MHGTKVEERPQSFLQFKLVFHGIPFSMKIGVLTSLMVVLWIIRRKLNFPVSRLLRNPGCHSEKGVRVEYGTKWSSVLRMVIGETGLLQVQEGTRDIKWRLQNISHPDHFAHSGKIPNSI